MICKRRKNGQNLISCGEETQLRNGPSKSTASLDKRLLGQKNIQILLWNGLGRQFRRYSEIASEKHPFLNLTALFIISSAAEFRFSATFFRILDRYASKFSS